MMVPLTYTCPAEGRTYQIGKMPPAVRKRSTFAIPVQLPAGVPERSIPLSPFDAYWIALPPVRRVFLFRPPPAPGIPFADVVRALASSLGKVLPAFHPFAGALTYSPEARAVSIVLPPDGACGVAFVEAETDIDFERLVEEGTEHDEDALRQLVPDIKRDELPAPVMAAQVTEFAGGGVAVGVTVHHAVADGRGLWAFLEMWAAAAGVREGRESTSPAPLQDRRLVSFSGDEELTRLFLQQLTPDLPIIRKQSPAPVQGRPLSRRTFTFAAPAVRLLKQRHTVAGGSGKAPSTFAALAAHGWVSIARAKGFTDDAPVFAFFLADCRAHMSPAVPGAYAGNCVAGCTASLSGSELTGTDGPSRAVQAIAEAVAEVKRDPLGDSVNWQSKFASMPLGRAVIIAGSPWFPAYGIDFGFGKPARVELASMNHDGEMVLVAGREAGSVQASVAITQDKMTTFGNMFVLERGHATT